MTGSTGPGGRDVGAPGPVTPNRVDVDPVAAARGWLAQHVVDGPEPIENGGESRSTRSTRSRTEAPGLELDPDADPEEVARRIVLRKLSAQARTRTELARALQAKAVPEEAASSVLDRMTEVGLVDDAGFARDWVESRQRRRHLSSSALRRELQTKGVDRDDIDNALAPVGVEEEYEAAISLARSRQARMSGLARDVQYRRLAGVLGRRGFGGEVASRVLTEVLSEVGNT